VRLLRIPYRFMFPCALFFIAIGVYSTNNSLFEVNEVILFGLVGTIFLALDFPVAPILLGYVLGPLLEENFRRTLVLSQGDLLVFFRRPISAALMCVSLLIVGVQVFSAMRARARQRM
jgi:putative tricarboxylic transport membrane protein